MDHPPLFPQGILPQVKAITDTGFLVAFGNRRDKHHLRCRTGGSGLSPWQRSDRTGFRQRWPGQARIRSCQPTPETRRTICRPIPRPGRSLPHPNERALPEASHHHHRRERFSRLPARQARDDTTHLPANTGVEVSPDERIRNGRSSRSQGLRQYPDVIAGHCWCWGLQDH